MKIAKTLMIRGSLAALLLISSNVLAQTADYCDNNTGSRSSYCNAYDPNSAAPQEPVETGSGYAHSPNDAEPQIAPPISTGPQGVTDNEGLPFRRGLSAREIETVLDGIKALQQEPDSTFKIRISTRPVSKDESANYLVQFDFDSNDPYDAFVTGNIPKKIRAEILPDLEPKNNCEFFGFTSEACSYRNSGGTAE